MLPASDAWKAAQEGLLAPEGFVEISYHITKDNMYEILENFEADDQAVFSNAETLLNKTDFGSGAYFDYLATNELNLWALDGTFNVFSGATTDGYVSETFGSGSVRVNLSEVQEDEIPGFTVYFSEEYGEYAEELTITAYNGDTVISTQTITGNTKVSLLVDMPVSGYDAVEITVHKWSTPYRRVRIERLTFGVVAVFAKNDIISFNHEQFGCLSSGELPKNGISFSLDNTTDLWNPLNPSGYGKYLSERQRMVLRYGFDIDGTVEWICPGAFYLTEWRTPSNGLEAHFVARDWLEFILEAPYTGLKNGTLYEIAEAAATRSGELSYPYSLDGVSLGQYSVAFEDDHTCAEVLQMCANAACCTISIESAGTDATNVILERKAYEHTGFVIPKNLSYSYPEYELVKPLKGVKVVYGENEYYLSANIASLSEGEIQTVENPFITSEEQAAEVATWVKGNLISRKRISGEFRCDPRLEVYDKVSVETKYGTEDLILTSINYTFTGAFRATYSGYVPEAST